MPLPTPPTFSLAPDYLYPRVTKLAQKNEMFFFIGGGLAKMGGASGSGPLYGKGGISVIKQAKLGNHQLTVAKIEDSRYFVTWLQKYKHENKLDTSFDLSKVKKLVDAYTADGIKYFLFNKVTVPTEKRGMKPLIITFKSKTLYYPMRVNSLYSGPSDVQLLVFSQSHIPGHRFEKVGFLRTKQITMDSRLLSTYWDGFGDHFVGTVSFQCFRMLDPRSFYLEAHSDENGDLEGRYNRALPFLIEDAMNRWAYDVSIDMRAGNIHDPKHTIDPWPKWVGEAGDKGKAIKMMTPFLGDDDSGRM